MKIKHLFFGFILGIIIVILNSCEENTQPVAIDEKPKDTIKTEEEIVLKIEELDSIYVNFSGVKGKFYSSDSDSRNNPPFTENEYIDDFKFNQKININDIFIKYSKNDTITNDDGYGRSSYLKIIKNKENKLFNFEFYYIYLNNGGRSGYVETVSYLNVKNIDLIKQDSSSLYFDVTGTKVGNFISNLGYNYTSISNFRGQNHYSISQKRNFISIEEISDSAKISIRIIKKKK